MVVDTALVRHLALFRPLSEAERTRLAARAALRRVMPGEVVFEQGETAHSFYLLVHGRLKVNQVTADGQQMIVRVVHPGDLFGFARILSRTEYPATARAAVESSVIGWPMSEWDVMVETIPRLATSALRSIGQRLDEAHTRLREISTEEVERRVAHAVLRLARQAGREEGGGTRIDFPITRQDIAEMTGTTLHTVSRVLSAWEAKGLVKGGRQRLTILDQEGLGRIGDPEG